MPALIRRQSWVSLGCIGSTGRSSPLTRQSAEFGEPVFAAAGSWRTNVCVVMARYAAASDARSSPTISAPDRPVWAWLPTVSGEGLLRAAPQAVLGVVAVG